MKLNGILTLFPQPPTAFFFPHSHPSFTLTSCFSFPLPNLSPCKAQFAQLTYTHSSSMASPYKSYLSVVVPTESFQQFSIYFQIRGIIQLSHVLILSSNKITNHLPSSPFIFTNPLVPVTILNTRKLQSVNTAL